MKRLFILSLIAFMLTSCDEDFDWDPNDYKVVVLNSTNFAYHFKTGKVYTHNNIPDDLYENGIINEPWCTDLPGLCGNYEITDYSDFSDLDDFPQGKYENWCDEMPLNKVVVFKCSDDTYAFVKVVDDEYLSSDNGCEHKVTLHVNYPVKLNEPDKEVLMITKPHLFSIVQLRGLSKILALI